MCKEFERIWLSNGNKFIIGDELTICDLHAFTEFQQSSVACGYDFSQKFPKIHDWMKRIYDIPEFKDVDKGVLAAVDFFGKSVTPPSKN
jgi:glutathione S-transferase